MTRPKLLVSVRSVAEAEAALAGGADLIDVKEPSRGPLGAADSAVVRAIVTAVDGRVPVSAALGEWRDWSGTVEGQGTDYVKWGLAGTADQGERIKFDVLRLWYASLYPRPVLAAYADADRANSPNVNVLVGLATFFRFSAFLIDTAIKDGTTLRDWIAPSELSQIRFRLAGAGVPVALAGSLNEDTIRELLPLTPDWFAVRGAACVGGRGGSVSAERVRRLKALITGGSPT